VPLVSPTKVVTVFPVTISNHCASFRGALCRVCLLNKLLPYGTPSDVSREVNDGRGPVDFKISRGASDKTLLEFKLASNSQLMRNLERQTSTYGKASDAHRSIKVIVYRSAKELRKVERILKAPSSRAILISS
jgi:hypothetical protein